MNQVEERENYSQGKLTLMYYATLLGAIFSIIPVVIFTVQFFQSGLWQWLATAVIAIFVSISFFYAWQLVKLDEIERSGKWMLFGTIIPVASISFFASGLTVGLIFTSFLVPIAVYSFLYQTKKLLQPLLIGIIITFYVLAIDSFSPFSRLTAEQSYTIFLQVWLNTAIFGLASFYLTISNIIAQSLRVKLIIAFLTVSAISVGPIIFIDIRSTSAALTDSVGSNISHLATSQATIVNNILSQQIEILKVLSLNITLQEQVANTNAAYSGSTVEIQAQIEKLDRQWIAAKDKDPLLQKHLNNLAVSELTEFQNNFPNHIEIFTTDKYGALVAATNRTSDYNQADEIWWQSAYNKGQGAVYIGQPAYDESSDTFALNIAMPLYGHNSNEIIGILRSTYDTEALKKLLFLAQFGQTGYVEIYLPNNEELEVKNDKLKLEQAEFDSIILKNLQASKTKKYLDMPYNGTPSIISQSPILDDDNPAVSNLNWMIVVYQDRTEALASVEIQQRNSFFVIFIVTAVAVFMAVMVGRLLAGPITRLTEVATQIAAGNLDVSAQVESEDEVGILTNAFNTMTKQLRQIIGTLEEQVAERTKRLETVVDVSHRLAGILDLSDLLRQVVNLTKETFNYYHVHIYLLEGETLIMAEGYGQPGIEMKRLGHNISLFSPKSLVATAARTGEIVIVGNVREDPNWLPNTFLPDTRSEMSVPVMLADEVVGVLDVQSEMVDGLTEEDKTTLQALANQIATAVHNARIFTQTQNALYEAQELQRLYTGQSWDNFGSSRSTDYEFRQPHLPPLEQITTPEAGTAVQQGQTVDLRVPVVATPENGGAEETADELYTALATPLKLGDQIIGVLGLHNDDTKRQWTAEEIALIEAVSEQMSLAIENARLFDDTQQQAAREKVVADITQQVWSSGELEQVMKTAAKQLGINMDASKVIIRLGTEKQLLKDRKQE